MDEKKEFIELSLNKTGEIIIQFPTGADSVVVSADHADYLAQAFAAMAHDAREGSTKRFHELIDIANNPLPTEREQDDWMKRVIPAIESLMPPGRAPSGRTQFSLIVFHPCADDEGRRRLQYGSNAPRAMARIGLKALSVSLQLEHGDGEAIFPDKDGAN